MKKILQLLGLFIFIAMTGFCQDEPYGYITNEPIVVYGYNFLDCKASPKEKKIAIPGLPFQQRGPLMVDSVLGPIYIIQFWRIKKEKDSLDKDPTLINVKATKHYQYYCIKAEIFKEPMVKKYYHTWKYNNKLNIGTLIVPIKMRPKKGGIPFDFTTDFTLGSSIGYGTRISHYQPNYLSLVAVFGVTSVSVDSTTTNGYVKKESTKLAALTPGVGVILELTGFQIGLVIGWDICSGVTG